MAIIKAIRHTGPRREGAAAMKKAPGPNPCAFLDIVEGKRGYRIALFNTKTDRFESYLVSSPSGCGISKTPEGATVFKTMKEVEAAMNQCGKLPCPPCDCENDTKPKDTQAKPAEKPQEPT